MASINFNGQRGERLSDLIDVYHTPFKYLISEDVFSRIKKSVNWIPAMTSPFWGYEISLSNSENDSDFLLCISKSQNLREALNNQPAYDFCPESKFNYNKLRGFSDYWSDCDEQIKSLIQNIWLEYDFEFMNGTFILPNFFFAPRKGSNYLSIVIESTEIFKLLSKIQIPNIVYSNLLHVHTQLENKCWISQIGLMLTRKEDRIRLFIQNFAKDELIKYLERIGYPYYGDKDLKNHLENCYRFSDFVFLDIDLGSEVGSKIGLEIYFDYIHQAIDYLKYLLENKLCDPAKYIVFKNHLENIQFDKSKDFQHFLSHFKLVFSPGDGCLSKAYVGFVKNSIARSVIRTQPINPHILNS